MLPSGARRGVFTSSPEGERVASSSTDNGRIRRRLSFSAGMCQDCVPRWWSSRDPVSNSAPGEVVMVRTLRVLSWFLIALALTLGVPWLIMVVWGAVNDALQKSLKLEYSLAQC